MNKITDLYFLGCFSFIAEIMKAILNGEPFPFAKLMMLSSRFSGKSHHIEGLCALALAQVRRRVVINFIRARNKDTNDAQKTIVSLLHSIQGGIGVLSNLSDRTIKVNKSEINFITLNEEKEKVQKTGGKIGLPIKRDAEYIITIFEEASQLNKDLVENLEHSVRGNFNTHYFFAFMSNPWVRTHWFCENFIKWLPESKEAEEELLRQGYNMRFDSITKTLYFRPRYTLNPFVPYEQVQKVENLKDINYNKWRIVSLGFTGNLNGSIYQASLAKLNETTKRLLTHKFYGGVDWGDGKSDRGSPTVAYFGGISIEGGIDVYAEFCWWNNKGKVLNTQEQVDKVVDFYIKAYNIVQKPITVYIDNAALGDFYVMFNQMVIRKKYNLNEIEFLPAFKPKNTWERVETVNALMCLGVLRYNKSNCKGLYEAMENCYEVIKPTPTENGKRERSHEWTHWLHALEYMIGSYMKEFQDQIPMFDSKSLGEYAIF